MAAYMVQKTVMSFCSCGLLKILPDLFFCRHCLTLRCDYCVSHEIDTTFCPHCFENLSSTEAKHKKNRCASCLECPRCFNTLSTRSYSRPSDPKKPPQKLYYLLCLFCNWRSHDPIVPDQPTSSGNWPIYKNPNEARITELINFYKSLTLKEIFDKQKKSTKNYGRNYMHFLEKFGLNAMIARKRAGLPNFPLDGNTINTPQLTLSEAIEDVPELPNDVFETVVDFKNISTLEQRFATPELQDENIDNLYPIRKHLHVKHSLRCRVCEHNVVKPEYNAVKFKIKHLAYYHVPEIKIIKCDPLKPGKLSQLILKLCNPAQTATVVSFEKLDLSNINEVKEPRPLENDDQITPKKLPEPINMNLSLINDIVIPKGEIEIAARDDTAEYDDTNEVNLDNEDPKCILWRKGNKVALKFEILIPDDEEMKANIQIGFIMNFMYLDTMSNVAILQKQPQSLLVPLKVVLNLPSNI